MLNCCARKTCRIFAPLLFSSFRSTTLNMHYQFWEILNNLWLFEFLSMLDTAPLPAGFWIFTLLHTILPTKFLKYEFGGQPLFKTSKTGLIIILEKNESSLFFQKEDKKMLIRGERRSIQFEIRQSFQMSETMHDKMSAKVNMVVWF